MKQLPIIMFLLAKSIQKEDYNKHDCIYFQDYKTYLDFVLALENRKEPAALQYIFKLLDIENKGYLNVFSLNYFFRVSLFIQVGHFLCLWCYSLCASACRSAGSLFKLPVPTGKPVTACKKILNIKNHIPKLGKNSKGIQHCFSAVEINCFDLIKEKYFCSLKNFIYICIDYLLKSLMMVLVGYCSCFQFPL